MAFKDSRIITSTRSEKDDELLRLERACSAAFVMSLILSIWRNRRKGKRITQHTYSYYMILIIGTILQDVKYNNTNVIIPCSFTIIQKYLGI